MKRKLRLHAETLRVLSKTQARQVGGGVTSECSLAACATSEGCSGGDTNPCEDPTNDYTWAQCEGTCGAVTCVFTENWGECPDPTNGCYPNGICDGQTMETCNIWEATCDTLCNR
jgi:hypothetical protein